MGGDHGTKTNFQEVLALRERSWEGLPPPPVFMPGRPRPTGTNQEDPTATPVATSLGLPNRDLELEPQIPPPPPPELAIASEADAVPESPVTPAIQSPSISIATLSDFTIADASDDESPIGPTFANTSDDESPIDPTAIIPHEAFYLEDGNVEVLCGNKLFRVHATVLSFHSPALRRVFGKVSLEAAESPNGCPRILSSDSAADFVTLLNIVYLPEYVTCPNSNELIRSSPSTDSLNGIKCRISPRSRPSSESRRSTKCRLSDLEYSASSVMRTRRHLRGSPLPNRSERESSAD